MLSHAKENIPFIYDLNLPRYITPNFIKTQRFSALKRIYPFLVGFGIARGKNGTLIDNLVIRESVKTFFPDMAVGVKLRLVSNSKVHVSFVKMPSFPIIVIESYGLKTTFMFLQLHF